VSIQILLRVRGTWRPRREEDTITGRKEKITSISKAKCLAKIAEFRDSHRLSGHWDETRDPFLLMRAVRRRRVTVLPEVYART